MFATEAWAERPLLVRVIDRDPGLEHILERQGHALDDFRKEKAARDRVESHHQFLYEPARDTSRKGGKGQTCAACQTSG